MDPVSPDSGDVVDSGNLQNGGTRSPKSGHDQSSTSSSSVGCLQSLPFLPSSPGTSHRGTEHDVPYLKLTNEARASISFGAEVEFEDVGGGHGQLAPPISASVTTLDRPYIPPPPPTPPRPLHHHKQHQQEENKPKQSKQDSPKVTRMESGTIPKEQPKPHHDSDKKVSFTVQKVEDNGIGDCRRDVHIHNDTEHCDEVIVLCHEEEIKRNGGKSDPMNIPLGEAVLHPIDNFSGPMTETEITCSDPQSSITKLLSKKFKPPGGWYSQRGSTASYKTYKYDISTTGSRTASKKQTHPGFRKRLHSKYESQDYDQIENLLFLKEKEKEKTMRIRRKWIARWAVNLLIGLGTAIVATVIEVAIEYSTEYKFLALKKLVDSCGDNSVCMALPLMAWICFNSLLVFIGALLVTCVEPQAAGSGIPQIKCYLNGVRIPGLLTLRALFAKALGIILSVSGGLACGKEGPMIHSGAIVAAGVSQGRSRVFQKDFKIFEYLRSDTERRDFVSGGAAAGVSAAFGAPVGGVLFSLEEGASFWNQSLAWRIVFASMVATFTVNIFLSAIHGHAADLSNPGLISFGQFPDITYQAIEIPVFLLMGVFGGLSGALFNFINYKLTVFRKKFITAKWAKILEAVIVASMSAVMAFLLIFLVPDCATNSHKKGGHHGAENVQMFCQEGEHNVMSHIFFKSPEASLIAVLHDTKGSYTPLTLALFAVLYFLLGCWTYGLSVSSGVFIPSLLTGAAWGRLVGMGVMALFPKVDNNVGKYALIGAACQLGGTVRMTISLTVILIECTGDITFGLPIVMVLIIAKWVGDFFNTGLYDLHIQLMGIPLLPWEPPEMSYDIQAKQVMNNPVIVLREVESVRHVLHVIDNAHHTHSGFPVVEDYDHPLAPNPSVRPHCKACKTYPKGQGQEPPSGSSTTKAAYDLDPGSHTSGEDTEAISPQNGAIPMTLTHDSSSKAPDPVYGRLRGLVLRSQLCLLLKHKIFCPSPTGDEISISEHAKIQQDLRLEHFRDAYPQNEASCNFDITEEQKNMYVNLVPYLNPTPYSVTENTSLPRMFKLFRGLGLRHLIVVNGKNEVVGMVTRKDLAKYRLKAKGVKLKVQELHIHSE